MAFARGGRRDHRPRCEVCSTLGSAGRTASARLSAAEGRFLGLASRGGSSAVAP